MNITDSLSLAPVSKSRASKVVLWTGQILFACLFIFGGINKLFGLQEEMVRNFHALGVGVWFRELVGALELGGGALLLTPRLSGVGALILAAVMVGAIFTHLYLQPPAFLAIFPAVIGSLLLLIARARRPETRKSLESLRG
jgi:putative oxidoreductase